MAALELEVAKQVPVIDQVLELEVANLPVTKQVPVAKQVLGGHMPVAKLILM